MDWILQGIEDGCLPPAEMLEATVVYLTRGVEFVSPSIVRC